MKFQIHQLLCPLLLAPLLLAPRKDRLVRPVFIALVSATPTSKVLHTTEKKLSVQMITSKVWVLKYCVQHGKNEKRD